MIERAAGPPGGVRSVPLLGVEDVAEGTAWLKVEAPEEQGVEPGRFFMLSPVEPSGVVFLGRPFSIGDVREGEWDFLLRVLGDGTAWMRGLAPGTRLRLVGPLGRPFARRDRPVHRMVAGGIGLAPFFHLARTLRRERPGARLELVYGERTASAHVELGPERQELFDVVERYTDDGTLGTPGTVVDAVAERLDDPEVAWYACGPHPMLRALASRFEAAGIEGAQFSLEERMACGFGVCQACVVPTRDGSPAYRLLCVDGPVVDPREVAW